MHFNAPGQVESPEISSSTSFNHQEPYPFLCREEQKELTTIEYTYQNKPKWMNPQIGMQRTVVDRMIFYKRPWRMLDVS